MRKTLSDNPQVPRTALQTHDAPKKTATEENLVKASQESAMPKRPQQLQPQHQAIQPSHASNSPQHQHHQQMLMQHQQQQQHFQNLHQQQTQQKHLAQQQILQQQHQFQQQTIQQFQSSHHPTQPDYSKKMIQVRSLDEPSSKERLEEFHTKKTQPNEEPYIKRHQPQEDMTAKKVQTHNEELIRRSQPQEESFARRIQNQEEVPIPVRRIQSSEERKLQLHQQEILMKRSQNLNEALNQHKLSKGANQDNVRLPSEVQHSSNKPPSVKRPSEEGGSYAMARSRAMYKSDSRSSSTSDAEIKVSNVLIPKLTNSLKKKTKL